MFCAFCSYFTFERRRSQVSYPGGMLYVMHTVPTRPNSCKIVLLVNVDRSDQLYLAPGESDLVNQNLAEHGHRSGVESLIVDAVSILNSLVLAR